MSVWFLGLFSRSLLQWPPRGEQEVLWVGWEGGAVEILLPVQRPWASPLCSKLSILNRTLVLGVKLLPLRIHTLDQN